MLGDKAFELIKELERYHDSIPPFDDDKVRMVYEEMQLLCEKISGAMHSTFDIETNNFLPEVKLEKAALERDQRLLLAYMQMEPNATHSSNAMGIWKHSSPEIKENLSDSEIKWFTNYNKSLAKYMKSIGKNHGLNLTQDIKPPKSLYIEVRSLVDYGKLELDDGDIILLKKNSQHLMPRSQSEPLIRQGILEQVQS